MLRFLAALAIATLSLTFSISAFAQALVGTQWLKDRLNKPEVVILDVRGDKASFEAGHIPGSLLTNFRNAGWVVKNAEGVDGMLPEPAKLEALIGNLGIDNDSHVVVVGEGSTANSMAPATRVYWTFKVLGHDKVSVLDGGFAGWISAKNAQTKQPENPLATGPAKPRAPSIFSAKLRPEMIVGLADVERAKASGIPMLDHRDSDFFQGFKKSGAARIPGTIPGAVSMPEGWMMKNGGGFFRSKAELEKVYSYAQISPTGQQINFCNTGTSASLGWFVSHELLGNQEARLYDGSLAEWTKNPERPVEQKIKLN